MRKFFRPIKSELIFLVYALNFIVVSLISLLKEKGKKGKTKK